jgi:hypothetical protein
MRPSGGTAVSTSFCPVRRRHPCGLLIETTVAPPAFGVAAEVVRLEIPYGRMRRRIDLPPRSYKLLELKLDRGYLFLRLRETRV